MVELRASTVVLTAVVLHDVQFPIFFVLFFFSKFLRF